MGAEVALVSCRSLPEPDRDALPLEAALRARGVNARWVAWDDPELRWGSFSLAVLRSTWNYHLSPASFLRWVDAVAAETRLLNPAPIVRWNAHKEYLLELEAEGAKVVPTELVRRGSPAELEAICARRGFTRVVIKPAVSAGSYQTERIEPAERARGQAHLERLLAQGDVLIQPYVRSVEAYGERSLIWIDGSFTHAIRKTARFSQDQEQVSAALPIAEDERRSAEAILSRRKGPLLYGRVDLARNEDGEPMLMELELIEPSLFLCESALALERLAGAIQRLCC